jgi:hypothetical protein
MIQRLKPSLKENTNSASVLRINNMSAYGTYGKKYPCKKYVGIAHSADEEANFVTGGIVLKNRKSPILTAELKEMLRRLLDGEETEESYKEMLRRLLRGEATEQYAALIKTRGSKERLTDEEERSKASTPLPEEAAAVDVAQQRIQYQFITKPETGEVKSA